MGPSLEGSIARDPQAAGVIAWVEDKLGGTTVCMERLPRWRPGWFLKIRRGSDTLDLYARGERGPDFPSPFSLEHEAAVHDLLEANGVPVPHVYGIVEHGSVRTLVMDRLHGEQGLALAASDAGRTAMMLEWVGHMAHMHKIDLDMASRRGFHVPLTAREVVMSDVYRRVEESYRSWSGPRDPVIEFLSLWVHRNIPTNRTRPAFVAWDSAQFLHDDGKIVALIDFELAHVGDPYMDLAALRTRDSMEPLGDLTVAFDRYAELTGEPVDFALLRYFEIAQLTVTLMLQYPVIAAPHSSSDYVTHLTWYTDSARYALDILGERVGAQLETLPVPEPRHSPYSPAHRHLVTSLRAEARSEPERDLARYGINVSGAPGRVASEALSGDPFQGWRARCNYRLARHLQRADEIGPAVEEAELADAADLLGDRPADTLAADEALVSAVLQAKPDLDLPLLNLFARRMQRRHMLLGPPDSLIVRHPALQPLPDTLGGSPPGRP